MCVHIKLIQSLRARTTYVKSFRMLKNPRKRAMMIKCDSILLVAVVDVYGLGSNSNLIWVSQHNTQNNFTILSACLWIHNWSSVRIFIFVYLRGFMLINEA